MKHELTTYDGTNSIFKGRFVCTCGRLYPELPRGDELDEAVADHVEEMENAEMVAAEEQRLAQEGEEVVVREKYLDVMRMSKPLYVSGVMVRSDYDIEYDTYRLMFEKDVATEKIADDTYTGVREVNVYYPGTTWQMFKSTHRDSWWLGWFVRKYPVENTCQTEVVSVTVELDQRIKYPDLSVPDRNKGTMLIHEEVRERW